MKIVSRFVKITLIFSFIFLASFSLSAASLINQKVVFIPQAPLGEWEDPRQQDACEEAVALMAMTWIKGEKDLGLSAWRDKLVELSNFQAEKYGEYRDASLEDIVNRIFNDYFSYDKVSIKDVLSYQDIILELEQGNLVLIPANGQALKNPNFTAPGPERHMVLIKGYDYSTKEFITNDPGTRKGADYRYAADVLLAAIRPYKTGYHEPFD